MMNLPFAYENQRPSAVIRREINDFRVTETLSFELSGQGEHLFLFIEKQGCNTDWVARELQKHFNLRSQDIGYAGKKDRYSLSKQWFSLHLPGKEVSLQDLDNDSFKVIESTRHNKKLRKGSIKHNFFKLRLKDVSELVTDDKIVELGQNGFPNYFGYQRFGHQGDNLTKADGLLRGQFKVKNRNKRGIYLSAARSFLFNLMLAERVKLKLWDKIVSGDCLSLNDSRAYFKSEEVNDELHQRMQCGDIHISGLMPGRQASEAQLDSLALESRVLEPYQAWINGLSESRLDSSRRSFRVIPGDLKLIRESESQVVIQFSLVSGAFATSLLRELFVLTDVSLRSPST